MAKAWSLALVVLGTTTYALSGPYSMVEVRASAAPQLGPCASSGRSWRLWAARHSRGERPAHWAPSHCLECSS